MSLKNKIKTSLYSPNFLFDSIWSFYKLGYWSATWRLYGIPIIKKHRKATIRIGEQWVSCSRPDKNSLGVFQKVNIQALTKDSNIVIGYNVGMSGVSISCAQSIVIGNNVLLGSGVVISDSDAHPLHPEDRNNPSAIKIKPIHIGSDCFIGARSIILKGVTIGEGSVVGAGSVVTKSIPPFKIAAGNPAKVIGNVERFLMKDKQ